MPRKKHDDASTAPPKKTKSSTKRVPKLPDVPATTRPTEIDDTSLRPTHLDEYVNQRLVVGPLKTSIAAAKMQARALDHQLLTGPPGLGKTTLARCVAREMEGRCVETTGPAIAKKQDLVAMLTDLQAGDVLFVDEIHRIPSDVEEMLYSAMEDNCFYFSLDTGVGAKRMSIPLDAWTLLGATTRLDLVSQPLQTRFARVCHFEPYDLDSLDLVVGRAAGKFGIELTDEAVRVVSERSRGVPRVALQHLRYVRDHAVVLKRLVVDEDQARAAFNEIEVDILGLDRTMTRYIEVLHARRTAGLSALASALDCSPDTLSRTVEPYLLQVGLVSITSRGRALTIEGLKHARKVS